MMAALYRLWRRLTACPKGEHRDGLVVIFGLVLWECADCRTRQIVGEVRRGSNRRRTLSPWDRPDDA